MAFIALHLGLVSSDQVSTSQGNLLHAVKRPVVLSPNENLLATLNKRLVGTVVMGGKFT